MGVTNKQEIGLGLAESRRTVSRYCRLFGAVPHNQRECVPRRARMNISWDAAYLAPYLATFLTEIGGKNFNQHHFTHIEGLRSLPGLLPDRNVLVRYANKWEN